jgi:hypothetical protein
LPSFVLACGLATLGACDQGERSEQPVAPVDQNLGTIGLGLTLSSTVTVSAVTYGISGNGIVPLSGQINVSDPAATPSAQVGGIPAGVGYLVTLTAQSTDGLTMCAGSGMVDVRANQLNSVVVAMECRATGTTGVIDVGGSFNSCPVVTSYSGSPATVSVGGAVALSVTASDADNDPLTYAWTASTGTLGNATTASTTLTCTAPGLVTLTVAVSDGMCQSGAMLTVTCVPFCAVRTDGTPCDDANVCTRNDTCQAGACVGANPIACQALDPCHSTGTCDPQSGVCSNPNAANGTSCNDQNACTQLDQCMNGACVGAAPVMCMALDQCHAVGTCAAQSGLCSSPPVGDGTACVLQNANAACAAGACGVVSCKPGFDNCDLRADNGCEVSLPTSPANCGRCGRACPSGASCGAGLCISAPPTGLTAVAGGWSVPLAWTAAPGATSYTVMRAAASSGSFQPLGTTTATRFVDDAVATGVSYAYAIVSNSEGGASAMSATASATPLAKQLCVTDDASSVLVFDASQAGAVAPVRTLTDELTGLDGPEGAGANLITGELFVALFGGNVSVFPLSGAGGIAPVRTLTGAASANAMSFFALDVDVANHEVVTADQDTGGSVVVLDDQTGAVKRVLTGSATQLGHPVSVIVDGLHGETFVGQHDAAGTQQILTFGASDAGNGAPRRVLGGTANTAVGGWALAYDRVHDELFSACNCNNLVMVYDRTASGNAAPKRTIQLPQPIVRVSSLVLDTAKDTLWVAGWGGVSKGQLMEIPRAADGAVTPLHPPVSMGLVGSAPRLARCN